MTTPHKLVVNLDSDDWERLNTAKYRFGCLSAAAAVRYIIRNMTPLPDPVPIKPNPVDKKIKDLPLDPDDKLPF